VQPDAGILKLSRLSKCGEYPEQYRGEIAERLKAEALIQCGSVAERLKAPVLKTGNGKPFVGSNPTASANSLGSAHTMGLTRP
jgi:hypothetical protein